MRLGVAVHRHYTIILPGIGPEPQPMLMASRRLQVAVYKGDDLILPGDRDTVVQGQPGIRSLKMHQVVHILYPQPAHIPGIRCRELRVKPLLP